MVVNFEIKFKHTKALQVKLDDTNLAQKYYQLLKQEYTSDPNVIFRDQKYYTVDKLAELYTEANKHLGWNWDISDLSVDNLTVLHKDIEKLVGGGYGDIPAELDGLVHDIHFTLHSVETGNSRGAWLQLEWFNDKGFSISPEEYPGKHKCTPGDIKLQNPWVGHSPYMCYIQDDYKDLMMTCKFHDWTKPGLNIMIEKYGDNIDIPSIKRWFTNHSPEFVASHGWDTIESYIGEPVVGKVINLDDLDALLEQEHIEFESIEFHD